MQANPVILPVPTLSSVNVIYAFHYFQMVSKSFDRLRVISTVTFHYRIAMNEWLQTRTTH